MNTLATYHAKNTGMLFTMLELTDGEDNETVDAYRVIQLDVDADEVVSVTRFNVGTLGDEESEKDAYDRAAAKFFEFIRAN